MPAREFRLPIKTEAHLAEFIFHSFGIKIPNTPVCHGHSTPWRAFCGAYFARDPVSVWKGSRGLAGKTFLLSLLSTVEALTLHADVNLLGGSGQQSKLGLEYVGQFLRGQNAPRYRLDGEVSLETKFATGAKIKALMASQTSVRGPHPQRLRLDEVDEMDFDIFKAALGQPMSKKIGRKMVKSHIVASSTHQYPDGTMSEILKLASTSGWPVEEWCFRESSAAPDGWLTEDEIERKKSQVPAQMWAIEYELQEPSAEGRAIDQAAVGRLFRHELGDFEGKLGEAIEIEAPQAGAIYGHGADWGKKVDNTEIGTLRGDVMPRVLVAYLRIKRRPWPDMVKVLDDRVKRYGGKAYHDATGLGDVVSDILTADNIEGIILSPTIRKEILSEYVSAIEKGELAYPFIKSVEADHRYATWDDLYGSGHCPDSIIMGALAHRVVKSGRIGAAVGTRTGLGPPQNPVFKERHGGGLFGDRHAGSTFKPPAAARPAAAPEEKKEDAKPPAPYNLRHELERRKQ